MTPELVEIRFEVEGHAMPGGSKKGLLNPQFARFEHGRLRLVNPKAMQVLVTEDSKNKPWRRAVAAAGRLAWPGEPLACALEVEFTFFRPRPQTHRGTGRNAGVVKPSAPRHPTTRPDVLKLARAAEDALTGIIWVDDSQIVHETLRKVWGLRERLEVVVRELPS